MSIKMKNVIIFIGKLIIGAISLQILDVIIRSFLAWLKVPGMLSFVAGSKNLSQAFYLLYGTITLGIIYMGWIYLLTILVYWIVRRLFISSKTIGYIWSITLCCIVYILFILFWDKGLSDSVTDVIIALPIYILGGYLINYFYWTLTFHSGRHEPNIL
jgi:hypothetical protein